MSFQTQTIQTGGCLPSQGHAPWHLLLLVGSRGFTYQALDKNPCFLTVLSQCSCCQSTNSPKFEQTQGVEETSCPQQEPSRSITSSRWGRSCSGQSWGTQGRHPAGWVLPQPHLPPVLLVLPDAAPQPSSSLFPLPHGPGLTSPAYKKQSRCSCPQAWLPLGSHWCPQHGCAGHPAGLPWARSYARQWTWAFR